MKKLYVLLAAASFMIVTGCGSSSEAPLSPAKAITAFKITSPVEATGVITEAAHTIAITVPYATNTAHLVATFTTTGASVEVGTTVQKSGETANNFTSPMIYTVTADDATTQNYMVTVTVTEVVNQPAKAIKVSMSPNNPFDVAAGIFCVKTPSITGSESITDPDGGTVIVREWYVNGVLKASGTNVLSGPFVHKDIITYKVTADGVVSDSIQWTIWCQYSC